MARTNERLVAGINTLPEVTRDDSGKVLGVNEDGKWVIKKDEADPELPVPTAADVGKVPSVDAQGKYALTTPEKELPAVSSTDNGKVLGVVDGVWDVKLDAGATLPEVTSADNGSVLGVVSGLWDKMAISAPYVPITYSALKALRDAGKLEAGTIYRMTDYSTIINGSYDLSVLGASGYLHNAVSAGHDFDLLLLATDASHLSEDAKAVVHSGDTYFTGAGANLDAWELKYDLDNDTNRYAWANATSGKGVIWWMKDEWNNQAGYDFKNIQFLRYALKQADQQGDYTPTATALVYNSETQPNRYGGMYQIFAALQAYMQGGSYVNPWTKKDGKADYDFAVGSNILGVIQFAEPNAQYMAAFNADLYYTFDYLDETSTHIDASFNLNTKIPCTENYISLEKDPVSVAIFNIFNKLGLGGSVWETNSIFVAGLQSAAWDNISHNYLSEHNWCNTFGDSCYSNTFGDSCSSNTFGDSCYSNTFGDSCYSNTFGYKCYSNTFGDFCYSNTFGDSCSSNTFGDFCYSNTFGDSCSSNTFGDFCSSNTFGYKCYSNTFGSSNQNNELEGNIYHIHGGDRIQNVTVPSSIAQGYAVRELINFDQTYDERATLITYTAYNTSTAVSTTDGGTTWA